MRKKDLSVPASPQVRAIGWDRITLEKVTELISRKLVAGDRQLLAQVYLKRGALVPLHTHESEQMTYVLDGALMLRVSGEDVMAREGEVVAIPAGTPHQIEALADTFALDVFAAVPADWLPQGGGEVPE